MLLHKLKFVAFSLLLLAAATSGGVAAGSLAMKQKVMSKSAALVSQAAPGDAERPRSAAKPDTAAADRMTVAGRVIDQDGKPVKGAVVELVAQSRSPWIGASEETFGSEHTLLGEGQSEGDGRFRLDAPRTGSTRVFQVYALAAAPGYGLGWAKLNPDAEQPAADIRLLPEQPIRARLVDVTGAPANRVEVRVRNIARMSDKGTRDSVWLWDNPPKGVRTWPQTVTTDDQGRFALPGIVHGDNVSLEVRDLRYARQSLFIDSSKLIIPSKEITLALEPARIIEGRVLSADTGRPIPNAIVSAQTLIRNKNASGYFTAKFRANTQGRFIMNPLAGESYTLGAFPTQGEPYLVPQDEIEWTKGAVKAIHDIKVRRGVLIRGKVTEQKTGRPLPASSVQYQPVQVEGGLLWGWQAAVASKVDGSFEIAVAPGKGHLLVFGPTGDYVLGSVAGQRTRAHAIIPYEVKVGDPPHEVAAPLRPGVTIKGRVEGPGGRTVTDGLILTTLHIEPFNPTWRGDFHVKVRDGRFELHGLDPNGATRIHVLDPDHEWGATVDVSGKQSGEDLTIRLEPCGKARARFVGWKGKPVFKVQPTYFELVATSGPSRYSKNPKDQGKPSADADFLANIDVKHYPWRNELNTDADGRFTMTSLIPDALYRILDFSTANSEKGAQVRKDFTVKPGETLDLGDILIEKPQPGEA